MFLYVLLKIEHAIMPFDALSTNAPVLFILGNRVNNWNSIRLEKGSLQRNWHQSSRVRYSRACSQGYENRRQLGANNVPAREVPPKSLFIYVVDHMGEVRGWEYNKIPYYSGGTRTRAFIQRRILYIRTRVRDR